jgi:hypothetical protein
MVHLFEVLFLWFFFVLIFMIPEIMATADRGTGQFLFRAWTPGEPQHENG